MPDQSSTSSTNMPAKKALIVALVLLLAVVVIAVYLNRTSSTYTKPASYSTSGQKQYNLAIDNGKLAKGLTSITVKKGDRVHIAMTGANMGEADVRIKAYGLNSGLVGFGASDLEFTADKTGTFPIEIRVEDEDSHTNSANSSDPTPWNQISEVVVK